MGRMKRTAITSMIVILALPIFAVLAAGRTAKFDNASVQQLKAMASDTDKYWMSAKENVYKTVPQLIDQHNTEIAQGLRHQKLMRGEAVRQIAITFDDGPHPKFTPQILAILKKYNVKASFFLVGEMAEKYPRLVKAEAKADHSIGNHTYHHVNLTKIPPGYVATEIKACDEVLRNILRRPIRLFRPPGGDYNNQVAETAVAMNYKIILWTDDPGDYASPGEEVVFHRTMEKADNGGIVLIHDGVQETINVLPRILQALKNKGYQFVSADQMLASR